MNTPLKAYLYFPKSETEKPIICHLIRDFNLDINIFRGKITPDEEGCLSLQISGDAQDIDRAFDYLRAFNVEIHAGAVGLMWDAARCTHCGHCTAHCPTDALHFGDARTRTMAFDETRCIECLACVTHCPFGACISNF